MRYTVSMIGSETVSCRASGDIELARVQMCTFCGRCGEISQREQKANSIGNRGKNKFSLLTNAGCICEPRWVSRSLLFFIFTPDPKTRRQLFCGRTSRVNCEASLVRNTSCMHDACGNRGSLVGILHVCLIHTALDLFNPVFIDSRSISALM